MNQYPFENLNDEQFEELAVLLCRELLGIGVKNFSKGRDGAKDGWFEGTAEKFPSAKDSWIGKFNIQAKHTTTLNASCSDNDFSSESNKTAVLTKELTRLKEIKKDTPFNCFLMFTNRKLAGEKVTLIERIKSELEIKNADLIGREQISSYLESYPFIANRLGLSKFIYPLRFFEKDIKDVILVFAKQSGNIGKASGSIINSIELIDKETKNELNNLGKDYFDFMKDHSLEYFKEIDKFLKEPKNDKYLNYYLNTVSDLQARITIERSSFGDFKELIEHLINFIVDNNTDIKDLRRIVRVFIHFMYFNCDIGRTK
jgi:hypothetical protein